MKTKLIAAAAFAAAALPTAALAQQRPPAPLIVVVDTQRIYRECTACAAAQGQLQAQITQLQQRAQQLGQPIEAELQSIQQAAAAARNQTGAQRTAAETALNQRLQALETRRTQAQQEIAASEQNIQSIRANVVQQINARLNPIINQVMTQRGANLALDVGATLAHAQGLNVTNEVLAALNGQLPSVSLTPLPQAQQPAQPQQPRPQGR